MSIVNRFPTSCPDSDTFIPQNLEPLFGVEVKPTSNVSSPPLATDTENVFSKEGLVCLSQSSAGAWLLAAPVAGLPSAGGMDGKKLTTTFDVNKSLKGHKSIELFAKDSRG